MLISEPTQTAEQAFTSFKIKNHYRLGSNDQVSLYPFPPLHNPTPLDIPTPLLDEVGAPPSYNDLRSIQGIVFIAILSMPLWAGISAVVWLMLH